MTNEMDKLCLEPFDPSAAITLKDAAKLMKGRGHKRLSLWAVRRFANPKHGFKGLGNCTIVLPTVKLSGLWWTMPSWVEQFEELRANAGRREVIPLRSPVAVEKEARAAMKRLALRGYC